MWLLNKNKQKRKRKLVEKLLKLIGMEDISQDQINSFIRELEKKTKDDPTTEFKRKKRINESILHDEKTDSKQKIDSDNSEIKGKKSGLTNSAKDNKSNIGKECIP